MIWSDLKQGDVLLSSYEGDMGAFLLLKSMPCTWEGIDQVEITCLCLNTAKQETHSRRARSSLSRTYTVLRGANVEQRGDGDRA